MTRFLRSISSRHFFAIAILLLTHTVAAQTEKHGEGDPDVTLNINQGVTMCDFDISPNLSQAEWSRAVKEVGNALYLEPLASAHPLGKFNWALQLENNSFHVDQESGAWNNTFHHPDSTHYLTGESGRLAVPGLRFRFGITERMDVGVYYTSAKPFGANYGFLGLDAKYAFWNDTVKGWAGVIRASYLVDAKINDFNISTTGLEVVAGKKLFGVLYPYAGLAGTWNHGREVTNDLALNNENHFVA